MIRTLPTLTVNGQLIEEFMAAAPGCCALGLVEEGNRPYAFLALRPDEAIPPGVTARGFNFGHALLGTSAYEVIQFSFEFYGFRIYHVLLNPSHPVVQTVVRSMIEDGAYFIFAVGSDGGVTAFREEVGPDTLAGLRDKHRRIRQSATTDSQYEQALKHFRLRPDPPGHVLNWVCQDTVGALDPTDDPLLMTPARPTA
jgi:hypothetical protein